jgi:ATP-dependent RNA helicase DeaD
MAQYKNIEPELKGLEKKIKVPQAIILAPTRELAVQVAEEINSLKGSNHLDIAAIYGGQSINLQLKRLKKGVDIVVGTPGRVKDHLLRKTLDLSSVNYFILDEADEMLNMGFIEDVEEILSYANKNRWVLLFSATMPNPIIKLARKYMKDYKIIKVSQDQLTVGLTDQIYFEVNSFNKVEALCRIIDSEPEFYGLIFCRTKINVDKLAKNLGARGYDSDALHGDISQSQRERILDRFRQKRINILVATDVAARGIDVSDLTHVINFSLPQDPLSYVHRIGRTGRAGRSGTAVTFVTPDEYRKLIHIKKITKTDIQKKKIPGIDDVISSRKSRIEKNISDLISKSNTEKHESFSKGLLDKNKYSKIQEPYVDKKGTTRLFIARGKADKMTSAKIVDMIKKASRIDRKKISDVSVFDKFSFITVSFKEAEKILDVFKKLQSGRKPIVERAKKKGKKALKGKRC